jgi:hypothetical protein
LKEELNTILQLEDKEDFQAALNEYRKSYSANPDDFIRWKHYYFFLWYLNVEGSPLGVDDFVEANKLDLELKKIAFEGLEKFRHDPDAFFILGYTINLFPDYFGDYLEWEEKGIRMMKTAASLSPENKIFKMVKLGLEKGSQTNLQYKKACGDAAEKVKDVYQGSGLLNSYFREVLYRIQK